MEKRLLKNIEIALASVLLLWGVFLLDALTPGELTRYGIRPRRIDGLSGILFSPFLHTGIRHLISNSGALFVLLAVSLSFSRKLTASALAIIILGGGAAVWIFGKPYTVHIGASGVIFGLIGFLIGIGVFRRHWKALAFSILAAFLYGAALMTLFVHAPGVSWAGHFWGFVSGVAAAWRLKKTEA